jgi:tRNA(Ile)-lysidine synthase
LAARLEVPFHEARVDTAAEARADAKSGKPAETIEEAARRLRYAWFRELLTKSPLHAVATAHTLDDQAETVLGKFLRGAWTEGLAGIAPKLEFAEGHIVRPLLATTRSEIEDYLRSLGQEWCEDSSNRHLTFTRNRIRHELLPLLEGWNPRLREHLAQMAELARGEEAWWNTELAKLAPQMLLPGRPARGGGRAAGSGAALAIETSRLAALAPALQRRLLRRAANQLGVALDFAATEAVRSLALDGRAGQRLSLPQGLEVERTARELQFALGGERAANGKVAMGQEQQYSGPIPGTIDAPAFMIRLRIDRIPTKVTAQANQDFGLTRATLRNWKPGDRVRLRHSNGLHKVKEVLERKHVTGTDRTIWPVLEAGGQIVWMRGVELEPVPGLTITAEEATRDPSPGGSEVL